MMIKLLVWFIEIKETGSKGEKKFLKNQLLYPTKPIRPAFFCHDGRIPEEKNQCLKKPASKYSYPTGGFIPQGDNNRMVAALSYFIPDYRVKITELSCFIKF